MLRSNPYKIKETIRENAEGMEGWFYSSSQVYAQRRIAVSRTHLFGPGIWVNVQKERYDTCSDRQCERRSYFLDLKKELNPFDSGLDLVRSQVLKGMGYEG
ncbi:hypothetical protein ALC57_10554 [Trachymyrmex cornetzi]|uniref:Uncharacterized protein n=1 Tax=Trachymyrmex cornetzi TaxID=471704 RepID=A0A151J410_9HYME|nr:hypothetical protein ALC57_10554 [Trachymyrmex cornetzi]